jgi:predicted nucleotidyltransferase
VKTKKTSAHRRRPARRRGPTAAKSRNGARKKIQEMVRRIVKGFDPEKIILFGSHARGDAGPDSDADLLVVMNVLGSKRETAVEIDMALFGIGMPKDVIVVTPEELLKYANIVGTIIYPALHEGEVLYERAA